MSFLSTNGTSFGNLFNALMTSDEIEPGSSPSYQLAKLIYLFHPLGLKMAESPLRMAQSQQRDVAVPGGPESVKRAFTEQWKKDNASRVIFQHATLARIYGAASSCLVIEDQKSDEPIDYRKLYKQSIAFSLFDPLNTSGSLVLNLNPNTIDFLKVPGGVAVQGAKYHRSRTSVMLNEQPIYLGWTDSAFGYVGRSVYQRALFPLKSFVQSMLTDDLVTLKAGILVEKVAQPGSVIDNVMAYIGAAKRVMLKLARVGNVIQIGDKDDIQSLNLQNLDAAHTTARKHIIENIATAADMPAKLLLQETFAEGFGEGTEDAKHVARYIDRMREELQPNYAFMDEIVMYRAWNPEFYETVQAEIDDYKNKSFQQAFYEWKNSFEAKWPNLLTEPDSEKAKTEDVKLKAIIATLEAFAPLVQRVPEVLAQILQWASDNLSENKIMFPYPLIIDAEKVADMAVSAPADELQEPDAGPTFSARDSLNDAIGELRTTGRLKIAAA